MKNNIASLFTTAMIASVLLFSCSSAPSSKDEYMNEYAAFIQDIKANGEDLTEEQWQEKDKAFEKFGKELYDEFQNDLGIIEQGKTVKYALHYGQMRGMGALRNTNKNGEITDAVNEFRNAIKGDEFKDAVREFQNVWDDDLKGEFEMALGELKTVWDDDLKGELGNSLDEVRTALQDADLEIEIDGKIRELEEVLKDEEIKGGIKDIIGELKQILEDAEAEAELEK